MRNAVERCLAVGVFDGVHLGHRAILEGVDTALTFSRHPLSVIAPASAPRLIMPLEERIGAIRACGVSEVKVVDFDESTADVSASDFAAEHFALGGASAPVRIRCGGNWRFGRAGEGNAGWLRERGIEVEEVPYAMYRGEAVSSSRIRRSLAGGEIEDANGMLGRRYSVSGRVLPGKGKGAEIGFPTLNIELESILRRGVYAVEVAGVRGVANYGVAPTMGADAWKCPVLEVHLLGGAIPDGALKVEFLRFLRPEREFASVGELRNQIALDVRQAGADVV
jgi:riboflavin kinase/FMN adenylyltransferase